jgi:hypothetical protein
MRTIAEQDLLLRARTELPGGLTMETDTFRDGWSFVRSANARRMEEQIRTREWSFIKIADKPLRSGVGKTSQEAIAGALKLALCRISEHFNAAEVEEIELTQYPWFFLARVLLCPYRIHQNAILVVPDEALSHSPARPRRRLSKDAPGMYPHFCSAVPMLKEMLVLSRGTDGRAQ